MLISFDRFEVMTFDCYGTLIDWERGILDALSPLRARSSRRAEDDDILEHYALAESAAQAGEYRRYREILGDVTREMADFLGITLAPHEEDTLAASVMYWKPFRDTVDALKSLRRRFRLAVISNIDDDLFAHSARHLEVPFDFVITAERVGAYKPSHENFLRAFETIDVPRERIVHAAQSLYHDIVPASALGLANVWVNRRKGKSGAGATHPSDAVPDVEVPDLAALAAMVEAARV